MLMRPSVIQRLCLLLCVLCASAWARGETLTVCEGTGTTNQYVPIYGYYWDTQNNTSTMIFPASMLESMANGTINSLTFYANASVAFQGGSITVQMGEVEQTTVSGKIASGLTDCYTGTPATGAAEYVITLDTPFEYTDGNLAIQIVIATKGDNYPRTYWYGESQGVNCSVNSAGSAQTFLPKTTFDYTAGEKPDYLVQVSDESVAFGELGVNTSKTLNVTLKNKGTNAVTPTVSGLADPFSTTYTPAELASGATMTIPVTFNPTEVGEYTGTMTIDCGAAGTFSVALTGSAAMSLMLCDGTTTNETVPIYGYYYDTANTKTRFVYPSSELSALVGKQITSVTFYTNSNITLTGGELSFYAGETENAAALSATVDDLAEVWKGALTAGGQELTFVFDTPLTYSGGNLAFGTNVNTKGNYQHLYFYGESMDYATAYSRSTSAQFLPKVKIAYAEPQDYAMSVNVESLDFGTVVVGGSKTLNVKVTNSGTQAITPAASGLEAPFSTAYTPAEVASADNVLVPVTFAPTAGGEFTATLTIDGGQAGTQTVTLTGSGLAVPTGYQETFDAITAEAKIPAGWKAVRVQGTTLNNVTAGNYVESDYGIDVMDVDGGGKAIAFDKVSSREDYVSYLYYLISPEIQGDVFITAKHTSYQYTSNRFRVFNVDEEGTILASTGSAGSEVSVNWIPAMSADEWSYGTFNMAESGRVAILMGYAEMDFFAADAVIMAPSVRIDGLADVPTEVTASSEGVAHFAFNTTVTNNGLTDVAAGDYNLLVYNATDLDSAIATIPGNALAQGVTAEQLVEFDYAPADLQPSQQVRFVVTEDMNASYAQTDYITLRALVPVAALYQADGTTALPEKTDVGVFRGSRTMSFALANKGTAPLTYEITPAQGVTVAPLSGTIEGDQQVAVTATFDTPGVFDGTVATIATNAGDFTVAAHAACLAETTFYEDFEDELDATWIVGASYQFSDRGSSTFGNADDTYNKKVAYISTYNYSDDEMITPAVEFNAETGLDLHLTTYGVSIGSSVAVAYSTNRVDWTALDGVTTTRNEYTNCTLTLPDEGIYYFKLEAYGAAFDDIYGGTPAVLAHDAMITDFAGPVTGMVNKAATYTATLTNMKPEADSFSVSLMDGETVVETQEVANLEGETALTFTYMPREAGTHNLQVVATADDYSVAGATLAVTIDEESAVAGIVINEGTVTNEYMPHASLYYYHSGGKYLYTADDIAGQVKAGDKIVKIGFLYKANDFTYDMPDIRIWAGNSEKTTFTDAKEVPISLDGLTQVFDCGEPDVAFDNTRDGELTYSFSQPIIYDGNTLEIVLTNDNYNYKNPRIPFYGTDVANRYQSEVWSHDLQQTPVGEDKINSLTDAMTSLKTFLPTIVLYVESEPAIVSGTVTDGENPVEGAQLSFTQEGKLYQATTDAQGAYSVEIIQAGEGYTLTVEAEGFETYTETLDITETMTKDVVLQATAVESVITFAATAEHGEMAVYVNDAPIESGAAVAERTLVKVVLTPEEGYKVATFTVETSEASEPTGLRRASVPVTPGEDENTYTFEMPGQPVALGATFTEAVYTAIGDLQAADGEGVRYVDPTGRVSDKPFNGVNIVITRHADGTVTTTKVVK